MCVTWNVAVLAIKHNGAYMITDFQVGYIYTERERERELYSSVEIVHGKFTTDRGNYRSDCVVCFFLI